MVSGRLPVVSRWIGGGYFGRMRPLEERVAGPAFFGGWDACDSLGVAAKPHTVSARGPAIEGRGV